MLKVEIEWLCLNVNKTYFLCEFCSILSLVILRMAAVVCERFPYNQISALFHTTADKFRRRNLTKTFKILHVYTFEYFTVM